MNSILVISQLLLPIVVAVILPLLHNYPKLVAWISTITMAITSMIGTLLLLDVLENGAFTYVFSSANEAIGIELSISAFSTLFAFIVTGISTLILLYSIESIRKDVEPGRIARYYTLLLTLLFAMMILIYTNDLFNTYVFMAVVAISATALVSIKQKKDNYMASFRYLLLNEMGSLAYLLGVAILYLLTGYLNMNLVHETLQPLVNDYSLAIYAATGLDCHWLKH
jgi:multicomponent Na+:H+ antiporter subunit D